MLLCLLQFLVFSNRLLALAIAAVMVYNPSSDPRQRTLKASLLEVRVTVAWWPPTTSSFGYASFYISISSFTHSSYSPCSPFQPLIAPLVAARFGGWVAVRSVVAVQHSEQLGAV